MNILQKIYYSLSPYVDANERSVANFCSSLNEGQNKNQVVERVIKYIQNDITVFNLWMEWRYRGYRYLNKATRRQLYTNFGKIKLSFAEFTKTSRPENTSLANKLVGFGLDNHRFNHYTEQWMYLWQIMSFLSPKSGRYQYQESSTFGKLLRDPSKEVLIGDCNQIVTLYIALFSLKYDVGLLQLKTYPGHVALHFDGIDIEATKGEFMKYRVADQEVLPIYEIISINLLDVSDDYYRTKKVPATTILESARLASIISSNQEMVKTNLMATYNNTVVELVHGNNYERALTFAKQSSNHQLINLVGTNGASYFLKKEQYAEALKFSELSTQKDQLRQTIYRNQGVSLMQKKDFHGAIDIFKKINDQQSIRNCYVGLFGEEQAKLPSRLTQENINNYKKIISNLNDYAKKSDNKELINHAQALRKHL